MARACLSRSLRAAAVFQSTAWPRSYAKLASPSYAQGRREKPVEVQADEGEDLDNFAVSSGISRPLSEILKQINKKVPDTLVKSRHENGFTSKYIPWYCYIHSFSFNFSFGFLSRVNHQESFPIQ